jgi:LPXTG-site transpeptidase (sortase) family protein
VSVRAADHAPAAPLQDPQPLPGDAPAVGVVPTRLVIADIGVDAPLPPLRLDQNRVLLPPGDLDTAGWYARSAVPGAVGPAILAGHVDDTETAGVFARLHELQPGAAITVQLSDGTSRRYRMDRSEDVAKTEFPTAEVYGPTPNSQLRIITCNGPYDFNALHYRNNLVVFAVPVG